MDIKNLIHVSLLLLVSLQYLPIIMVSILFLVHLFAFSVILTLLLCEQIKKALVSILESIDSMSKQMQNKKSIKSSVIQ